MIEVTITRQMLDTDLQSWFLNVKNAERAKQEILRTPLPEITSTGGIEQSFR